MTGIFSRFRPLAETDTAWLLSDVLKMDKRAINHLSRKDLESLVTFCTNESKKLVKIFTNINVSPINATYISKLSGDMRLVNEIKKLASARIKEI